MFNSFIVLAVAGIISANVPETPEWQSEYRAARTRAMDQKKPLAVFIGAGQGGYSQVMSEGTLDGQINGMLAKGYVCLYADLDTESGKALAGALQIGRKSGLVISDAAGRYQAFSHEGNMKSADLATTLVRFAEVDRPMVKTEVMSTAVAPQATTISQTMAIVNPSPTMTILRNGRYYVVPSSSSCPNGNCPNAVPNCPTGNCPNR